MHLKIDADQTSEMIERAHRKLIAAKEISNGYLAYPATLMIKCHKIDKQYTKFKSFY